MSTTRHFTFWIMLASGVAWTTFPSTAQVGPVPKHLRGESYVEAPRTKALRKAGAVRPAKQAAPSEPKPEADPNRQTYRGYFFDVTAAADRPDRAAVIAALKHQIDIVEQTGLSQRVLQFFRTIPIVVDEFACLGGIAKSGDSKDESDIRALPAAGCYGAFVAINTRPRSNGVTLLDRATGRWNSSEPVAQAEDTGLGVISIRPTSLRSNQPLLLHELLHAYHNNVIPGGARNPALKAWYEKAKKEKRFPENAYAMLNEREFFAVTGSVFLYGEDGPITRSTIKNAHPDYYQYLVWLFGFDPEQKQRTPVAAIN